MGSIVSVIESIALALIGLVQSILCAPVFLIMGIFSCIGFIFCFSWGKREMRKFEES